MEKDKIYILINISEQKLTYFVDEEPKIQYSISTAKNGIGNKENSYKTPLGKHIICEKIGTDVKLATIFKWKYPTKQIAEINPKNTDNSDDLITTRIMCLEGLEIGINKGGGIDSKHRNIWIHGTQDEKSIGTSASHGCIRMKNDDIVELYNLVCVGTKVIINEN